MYVPTVWALTTGEAGMRAQALGLAEALGFGFDEKTKSACARPGAGFRVISAPFLCAVSTHPSTASRRPGRIF